MLRDSGLSAGRSRVDGPQNRVIVAGWRGKVKSGKGETSSDFAASILFLLPSLPLSLIHTARRAGLLDDDLAQARQGWLQTSPDPASEVLAGGVFQPVDFIEAMVVELVKKRLESPLEIGKIHDPAGVVSDRAGDMNFNTEGVTVHASALVVGRHIGQEMCGLDLKYLENFHACNCSRSCSVATKGCEDIWP